MLRTDTGNFNRFLTSLGLLLVLGALLVPYFYFHDTDTLRIPVSELEELTPVAREALETRQRRERDLEAWVLGFSVALAVGGIGSILLGGRRLRAAQRKEDDEIDRKAKRDDLEFRRMSQAEVAEKREEQARESVREAPPADGAGIQDSRAAFERIETLTKETLEKSTFASYEFLYEVKTVRGTQQLQLDGIFRSPSRDGIDVLLELKVVLQSRTIRSRARQFSDQLLALLTRYRRISSRSAVGWLVVVVPQEVDPLDLEERRCLEDHFNESLAGTGTATVVHESQLAELPSRFRQLFEDQAK